MDHLTAFIKSVLDHLPSSSSPASQSSHKTAFGELLVDLIWSAEASLEEGIGDKSTEVKPDESAAASDKDNHDAATRSAEEPKPRDLLIALVKGLLVR